LLQEVAAARDDDQALPSRSTALGLMGNRELNIEAGADGEIGYSRFALLLTAEIVDVTPCHLSPFFSHSHLFPF
jgi:hypothetical protein